MGQSVKRWRGSGLVGVGIVGVLLGAGVALWRRSPPAKPSAPPISVARPQGSEPARRAMQRTGPVRVSSSEDSALAPVSPLRATLQRFRQGKRNAFFTL